MSATGSPYRTAAPDDVSGIVRSIRMAAALNERFGQLAKPKTYHDSENLSADLGEARQVYPEIWANLDHARAQLVKRGHAVDAYDALRASPAAHAGGVLDVELTAATLTHTDGKSATMNTHGHVLAIQATNALKGALPQIDWEGLDRAEAEELAAFGSLGPARWKKAIFYLVGGVIAALGIAAYILFRIKWRGG